MLTRYRALTLYTLSLATVTSVLLGYALQGAPDFPPWWAMLLSIAACLFVWQFGLPAPRVGLISMERLPQIGLLLILSPPVAAVICGAASLLWPLVSRRYSQGSTGVAALRALHNSSMTALMLLLGGWAYLAVGGQHPLATLRIGDFWPLVVLALVVQIVNLAAMALYMHLDGRDLRKVLTPFYTLSDLLFVPAGVLAAIVFNSTGPATFVLFAGLMVLFVLSFSAIGRFAKGQESTSGPLAQLVDAGRALRGARSVEEVGERTLSETRALVRFDEFYLVLTDEQRQRLEVRVHERSGTRLPPRVKDADSGLFGWVMSTSESVLVSDWATAPAELQRTAEQTSKETGSLIAVPLIDQGRVIGLLSVQHTATEVYSAADLHLMQQLAEQAAPVIADATAFEALEDYRQRLEQRVNERTDELERANQDKERLINALRERSRSLERESQEDPLTGIANRRLFDQRLVNELDLARTLGTSLTVAIADLDHFKSINDRLGHAAGDEVLRQSSALMVKLCRSNDLVARLGGEEFALILPGMQPAAAYEFCERLRAAIESHDWLTVGPDLKVTLSIGVAHWEGLQAAAELLDAADANLYRAKHAGRNRVAGNQAR
jgi:diguanylate cyclase (GGDEF)-like protein